MGEARRLLAALAAAGSLAVPAAGQVVLSGSLDLAYKHDVARAEGEAQSKINTSMKGQSPFSLVRTRLFADAELDEGVMVLTTTLYDEGVGHLEMEGAYILMADLGGRPGLSLEVGKMATPFGRFASRSFASANPLVGIPLIYHYFSAVRGNQVPTSPAQQLAWRDAAGAAYQVRGLPTIYDACWATGMQLFGATRAFAWAAAVAKGAPSNPAASGNDGFQVVGRLGVQPTIGWQLGLSGGWGPYLEPAAGEGPGFPRDRDVEEFRQAIVGADASYSAGHLELVAEVVHSRWEVPNLAPGDETLAHTGGYLEGAIALRPGLQYALRLEAIRYGRIDDGSGRKVPWDYDIQRLETGLEYYLTRDVHLKAGVQLNRREVPRASASYQPGVGAPDDGDHMVGAQLSSAF